jgi:hypothetical protein
MRVRRVILALLVAFSVVSFGIDLDAAKGSGHATKSAPGGKTVHVKEYTRKDGKTVAAHERAAPHAKAPAKESPPSKPATVKAEKVQRTPAVGVARNAKGRIARSEAARHAFEVQTGYPHGRKGYVVDHVRALACGGADAPSNMQWQTIEAAKAKDRVERVGC